MKKGFTLIELIVVIALIGILAIVLLTIINPFAQIQKSTDARRKSDLALIQKALESYYSDHGSYPIGDSSHSYQIYDSYSSTTYAWGHAWTNYMDLIPADLTTNKKYIYISSGQSYQLYASLDRGGNDPQACNSGAKCSGVPASVYCGINSSYTCNYGVSSPNVSP